MMTDDQNIFGKELKVINIGIDTFPRDLKTQGVHVIHVRWHPPAGGDLDILKLLEKLEGSE